MLLIKSIRLLTILMLASLLMACSQQEPEATIHQLEGKIFGTSWTVSLAQPSLNEEEKERLTQEIAEVLNQVDWQMSTWKSESELMQFNRHEVGEGKELSNDLMTVLDISRTVAEQSQGAFDITVGGLVNLWSFGPEQRPEKIPSDEEINEAKELIGYDKLILDKAASTATREADFFVDLSAVAKGYAVDQIAQYLEEQNKPNFLVNIGGELLAKGERSTGEAWRVGIEVPHEGLQAVQHIIPLSNMSVATSGDYRNFFEEKGKRYSHTINPVTGKPIEHKVASVTVLHSQNAYADAWATAFMVMGLDGMPIADALGLRVLLLEKVADNTWEPHLSEAMQAYLGAEVTEQILQQ